MNCGFLIFEGAEELDFVGPWELVGMWAKDPSGPKARFTVSRSVGQVSCAKGLRVMSDVDFETCPPLEFLIIPGGMGVERACADDALIRFVRLAGTKCRAVASVCTGSLVLAKAGLLENKKATTHWRSLSRLRQFRINVIEERYVQDGNIWSSAGVSAGMDMVLGLISATSGSAVAGQVQRDAEYFPSPAVYEGAISDSSAEYVRRMHSKHLESRP